LSKEEVVRAVLIRDLHCDQCADVRAFDQPPCRERHEPECPEWACTKCGNAVLVGPVLTLRRRARRAARTGPGRRLAA